MRIYCTVTNELRYDQRMIRICTALQDAGHSVCLVGRRRGDRQPLPERPFEQKRLRCWFHKGKLFYLEYNLRLFFFLLFRRWDTVCSVDLDTILPGFYAAKLRGRICVHDAHEYFSQVPEVVERPRVQRVWEGIARRTLPRLRFAYTVCRSLADIFEREYGTRFEVVRNVPFAQPLPQPRPANPRFTLLYQGVLNEGRGLEELLQALVELPEVELWLAGEGDRSQALRDLTASLGLQERVRFWGYVQPEALKELTLQADLGINLLQNKGLNYYYSLANKFFDYIQALVPSLNMDFPEYAHLTALYPVACLVPDLQPATLTAAIERLRTDTDYYQSLRQACLQAREVLVWEREKEVLLDIYKKVENFKQQNTKNK